MAVALPQSAHGHALWFGSLYIAVRLLGLGLYLRVAAANNPQQRSAVQVFGGLSLLGLGAVGVGSFVGGDAQYAWWGAAVVLDFVAAGVGGRSHHWDLHPEHFAERHGLFVIIALGESLIVAAAGLTSAQWSLELIGLGLLAVAVTCVLWWTYFVHPKPELDHALESCPSAARAAMARDVFSLAHFPILGGIVAYAVGVEIVVHDAHDPLGPALRFTFGLAIALYTVGTALATWRAYGRFLWLRAVLGVGVLALSITIETTPIPAFAGLLVVLLIIAGLEKRPGGEIMRPETSRGAR